MTRRGAWTTAFVVAAIGVVAGHLIGLSTSPPGMHNDEASIGYNAWTIAHFGTDQFGTPWPLLFRDFGDYKGPISTYPLAPLTLVLPVTSAVIRLPSAVAGIALAIAAALLAWRLGGSRVLALVIMLEAAFEPWFFHTARIALEADLFTVLCFVIALAALAGQGCTRLGNCVIAGAALGVAPFAAQPGRYFTLVLVVLIVATHRRSMLRKGIAAVAAPALAATVVLFAGTPAGAAARLADVSVFHGQSLFGGVLAWAGNYLRYVNPDFLFLKGDPNPRHSSGFGGLLFLTAIPLLVLGLVSCARRWREPMCRLTLVGLLIAPLGPALTTGISARRDVVFLPFAILALIFGWQAAIGLIKGRPLLVAAAAALVGACVLPYLADYTIAYPQRAAAAFDTGETSALVAAHRAAGGHAILISPHVPDLPELALVTFLPPPGTSDPLRRLNIAYIASPSQLAAAHSGDVVILTGADPAPAGFTLIDEETLTGPASLGGSQRTLVLFDVYQR